MKSENIRNESVTVGTSPVIVSEAKTASERSVLFLTNTSTGGQTITVSAGDVAAVGKGIVLSPGGFYQDSADQGYKPTNDRVTAIASAANGTLAVHERVILRW